MKQSITLKKMVLASCVAAIGLNGGVAKAQSHTSHPLAFATSAVPNNFYKDYVGTRVQLSQPASAARDYPFTTSFNTGTTTWGGDVTSPIVDVEIVIPTGATGNDSFACSPLPAGSMAGKIGVIWRGPLTGACEFGSKALAVQNAGAIACVIINEYPGEGPVGMAAGAAGATVTIPVFMIGNTEGAALAGLYRSSPAGTVKMSFVKWGKNLAHDLGFVPGGISEWAYGAIPSYQLAGSTALAYKGLDGAFIANYGTSTVNNPQLESKIVFTPTETGVPATIHTNTLSLTPTAFPTADSIYALFGEEFDLATAAVAGKGKFDYTYTITSTETDDASGDNTITHSFYTTDSIFSKGRYDLVNDRPVSTFWTRPGGTPAVTDYLWGVPYFVSKGGAAIKNISFSASGSAPGVLPGGTTIFCYVFKWVDGTAGTGSLDSAIEGGELQLLGASQKTFDGTNDSTFNTFTTSLVRNDTTGNGEGEYITLADNTWYFVVAQMTGSLGLGCDGEIDLYPRAYGRQHFHNVTELYNPLFATAAAAASKDEMWANPTTPFFSYFGGGGFNGNAFNIDSVHYAPQYGLVPALSFKVTPWVANGVKNTTPTANKFEVFPNPSRGDMNVALELPATAKNVTYTILSSTAQLIATEKRTNILSDVYTYNTSKLAPGNYFMIVSVDGKIMNKKFTVIK